MNIAAAVNKEYLPYVYVLAKSFRLNNSAPCDMYILHGELSSDDISAFTDYAARLDITARFIHVDNRQFESFSFAGKAYLNYSVECWYKFLIPEFFKNLDRVLLMDIDMVINGNIEPLYHTDLKGNCIAATPNHRQVSHRKRLDLPEGQLYVNAGLILFDIRQIRELLGERILFETHSLYPDTLLPDQDIVNIAFAGRTLYLDDKRYNRQFTSGEPVSREEYRAIRKNTVILHYIKHTKPWNKEYVGRQRGIYLRYLSRVYPFRALRLWFAGLYAARGGGNG